MQKIMQLAALTVVFMASSQCVQARGEITLKLPAGKAPAQELGKKVFIKTVRDSRAFEDKPVTANIPTMAQGLANATDDQKSHAVARARDGYGKARHNVFAVPDQSVESIVRKTLTAALINLGYTVVENEADADKGTIAVSATVDRFWGYIAMSGNAWSGSSMSMDGEMKVTLDAEGGGITKVSFEVSARASHRFRVMSGGHWALMFEKLTDDFLKNFPKDKL